MSAKKNATAKRDSAKPVKKHAKKVAKPASKQQAKKAAKRAGVKSVAENLIYTTDYGLMTAFHHMQRASVVISLMEKGTGKDLRDLLKRGVKLYEKAIEGEAGNKHVLRAIGVVRAAEHLSMAGLYAARAKHKQKVTSPTPAWLQKVIKETGGRLETVEHLERSKGADLFPVTVELLRQAEDADHDAHLAFELAMAADALCFALENGL